MRPEELEELIEETIDKLIFNENFPPDDTSTTFYGFSYAEAYYIVMIEANGGKEVDRILSDSFKTRVKNYGVAVKYIKYWVDSKQKKVQLKWKNDQLDSIEHLSSIEKLREKKLNLRKLFFRGDRADADGEEQRRFFYDQEKFVWENDDIYDLINLKIDLLESQVDESKENDLKALLTNSNEEELKRVTHKVLLLDELGVIEGIKNKVTESISNDRKMAKVLMRIPSFKEDNLSTIQNTIKDLRNTPKKLRTGLAKRYVNRILISLDLDKIK